MIDSMPTLNVIGPGRVGRTLAALFQRARVFDVQAVLGRSAESTREAVALIGAGVPADSLTSMRAADVWLVSTPDRAIARVGDALAESGLLREGDVVFHCSGALASSELAAASARGARIASVHPLKTFATPAEAAATFAGTPCVVEGDAAALAVLTPAFERIGARLLGIESASKTLYHAASVIVCNDLVALLDAGLRCFDAAGIPRDRAAALIEPIVRETVDHVFGMGTARALTGPISRGDDGTVARHLDALRAWDSQVAKIYGALGAAAVDLAKAQGGAPPDALDRIGKLLEG